MIALPTHTRGAEAFRLLRMDLTLDQIGKHMGLGRTPVQRSLTEHLAARTAVAEANRLLRLPPHRRTTERVPSSINDPDR